MAKITFDFSEKSVNAAIKQIKKLKTGLTTSVSDMFLQLSVEWIKKRAIFYLQVSKNDLSLMQEIANSFTVTALSRYLYKLENTHEKGAFIEFGVGVVGQESAHEEASAVSWQYNIPTEKKSADGSWTFYADIGTGIDVQDKNREERIIGGENRPRLKIITRGNEPARFMYQAVIDYMHNGEYRAIYKMALAMVWGS